MDDDDLFDENIKKAPARKPRFLPKCKSVPKSEPPPPSQPQEPELSVLKEPKSEEKSEQTTKTIITLSPKAEPSFSNGDLKMESKPVPEVVMETNTDESLDTIEEDDVDMIVREIDVYFTPSIDPDTQLYVMQYPMRPCWRPYELDERCEEVRVKPSKPEVEIDLAIDTDSNNWDSEKASSLNISKQTLSSSWKPPVGTDYAVGVLVDNKLYLNPVHAIVQLRPSSACAKSVSSKGKNNNKQMESSSEQNSNDEECWVPLKYHSSKSDFSARYLEGMLAQENSPIHFTMNPHDYFHSLCPVALNSNNKGSQRRVFLSMPLEERVQKLLREGPPVSRFSSLMHFAPDFSIEDVLGVIQKHALLVQGLWAPKSPLLFSDKADKAKCFARDYVLMLFNKDLEAKFQQENIDAKLRDHIKVFLKVFAVERPSFKDWKFKAQKDMSFIKEYPNIVQKQGEVWASIEKQITDVMNRYRKVVPGMKNAAANSAMANRPSNVMNSNKGASGSVTGNKAMSNESQEALRKALVKFFQNHKVCSKQGLRDWAVSQSTLPKADARVSLLVAEGVDSANFEEVISQVATNIHGYYVLKSSPENNPELDRLRKIVLDLLLGKGPDAKLKKADVVEAARHVLQKEITSNEYLKVMNDFCESKGSAWVLKKPK
ncbi:hypothetical protein LWI29_036762 [Acer saccharum]|uniref:DNA-directed RNA polymerase III subunit RPC5 n=1 Tax=Acer saccharum TaxID=4024 RepID=A0AA39SWM7_ACESA|nr:hypothetical protein LWI29_036762 [Acer saccharum]